MFRAAVLSIVLTLVAGANGTVLCAVLCPPVAATAPSCQHPNATSTPGITENDSCPDIAAVASAFVREDVRRGVAASDGQPAVVAGPFVLVAPPKSLQSGREPERHPPLEAKPLVLALRI